LQPTRSTSPR